MGSQSKDGHTGGTRRPAEAGDDEAHPVEKDAAELSERAAESVSRSYDGTKEAYSIDPGQVESDEDQEDDRRG
jgi:hypothetical protein